MTRATGTVARGHEQSTGGQSSPAVVEGAFAMIDDVGAPEVRDSQDQDQACWELEDESLERVPSDSPCICSDFCSR
jgi:hypothetical protein